MSDEDVASAVGAALAHGGRPALELAVVFVSDADLAKLHADFLGDPSETDVISFDLGDDSPGPGGELYVSVDRAHARSAERGVPVERELALYVVHGALHLSGFDDRTEREQLAMRDAERAVMDSLGYPPDGAPHEFGA